MKKIVTIIGARPQFIKAKLISEAIRKEYKEVLIHTGQHYDELMSDVFFRDLNLPWPDYNLNIGSGSHANQTGRMMPLIEDILIKEKPDMVLLYGDTNSTLAGALTASKLNTPIAHIEAGLRSHNREMPEEINRILTDHVSDLLFAPTGTAIGNLGLEGLYEKTHLTGDIMYDMIMHYKDSLDLHPSNCYLATIHRPSNTDDVDIFSSILNTLDQLDKRVIFPVHPRIQHSINKSRYRNIDFIPPVGYIEMIAAIQNCYKVITDSGGIQKETYILNKQCITLREDTEWTETLHGNWNILAGNKIEDVMKAVYSETVGSTQSIFGEGKTAKLIMNHIRNYLL